MSLFFLSVRESNVLNILSSGNFLSDVRSDGERITDISTGGGRRADPPDQPDVQHVPSLHEEKQGIPDSAPQHPLLSPGANSPDQQSPSPGHHHRSRRISAIITY